MFLSCGRTHGSAPTIIHYSSFIIHYYCLPPPSFGKQNATSPENKCRGRLFIGRTHGSAPTIKL